MKIAFIVGQFPVTSKTFILNQITGLIDRGHEIDIYADRPKYQSANHADIIKYHLIESIKYEPKFSSSSVSRQKDKLKLILTCFPKNPLAVINSLNIFKYGKEVTSLKILCQAAPAIRTNADYDIIQCHLGKNGLKGLLLKDLHALKGKLVTTFHGIDITQHIQEQGEHLYDELWSKGDFFLPISEHWNNKLVTLGCAKSKIRIHHMGIDCSRFKFIPRTLSANEPVRFVTVNRLVEKKGIEYSLKAISKLAKCNQNIEYNILGEGPLLDELKKITQSLEINNFVNFLGWKPQEQVVKILESSDIMLAPSITSKDGDQEGIPVALMEAMAMGLPIISTQHSGIPELVQNGISGFLVPERDVDALFLKLDYLASHPETWSEMGKAGRAYVEEHFNIDKLNDQLVGIYEELIV